MIDRHRKCFQMKEERERGQARYIFKACCERFSGVCMFTWLEYPTVKGYTTLLKRIYSFHDIFTSKTCKKGRMNRNGIMMIIIVLTNFPKIGEKITLTSAKTPKMKPIWKLDTPRSVAWGTDGRNVKKKYIKERNLPLKMNIILLRHFIQLLSWLFVYLPCPFHKLSHDPTTGVKYIGIFFHLGRGM